MDNICTRNLIFLHLVTFTFLVSSQSSQGQMYVSVSGWKELQYKIMCRENICEERGRKTTTLTYPGVFIVDILLKKTNKVIGKGKTSCTESHKQIVRDRMMRESSEKLMMMRMMREPAGRVGIIERYHRES